MNPCAEGCWHRLAQSWDHEAGILSHLRQIRVGSKSRSRAASRDGVEKAAQLEAGAADEGPVDVGKRREFADVFRFDAAAVDDVALVGRGAAKPLPQPRANVRVRFVRLRGCGVAPGP